VKAAISVGIFAIASALLINLLKSYRLLSDIAELFAAALGGFGAFVLLVIVVYQNAKNRALATAEYVAVEQRARDNPDEPSAAWDLARIKLESYLDKNLLQVSWIYYLILLVMFFGFVMVGLGIWRVYQVPQDFPPSIVAVVSGIVAQFIAATFLLIYKATMAQAKDYVTVLERINAVGMSIQILESIEGTEPQLRNSARSELAKDLLRMYGPTTPKIAKGKAT
jgi:hypothetical protein